MKAAAPKPKEASMKSIDTNRKILITALLKHSKGPISNLNNSKTGWNNVLTDFNEGTNLNYNEEKLTHQVASMRKIISFSISSLTIAASELTNEGL